MEVTTKGGWEAWLLYVLHAVDETSRWTTAKIRAIRQLLTQATAYIRAQAPKVYSRELVDVIFNQPYCRIENLVDAGIAKRQTVSRYLAALAEIGVLGPVQAGREKLFIHRALLELLTSDAHTTFPYQPTGGRAVPADQESDDITIVAA